MITIHYKLIQKNKKGLKSEKETYKFISYYSIYGALYKTKYRDYT